METLKAVISEVVKVQKLVKNHPCSVEHKQKMVDEANYKVVAKSVVVYNHYLTQGVEVAEARKLAYLQKNLIVGFIQEWN